VGGCVKACDSELAHEEPHQEDVEGTAQTRVGQILELSEDVACRPREGGQLSSKVGGLDGHVHKDEQTMRASKCKLRSAIRAQLGQFRVNSTFKSPTYWRTDAWGPRRVS
jgi:hypothetical protein